MTTDRALEIAEALLHEERTFPRQFWGPDVVEALRIIGLLRSNKVACLINDLAAKR